MKFLTATIAAIANATRTPDPIYDQYDYGLPAAFYGDGHNNHNHFGPAYDPHVKHGQHEFGPPYDPNVVYQDPPIYNAPPVYHEPPVYHDPEPVYDDHDHGHTYHGEPSYDHAHYDDVSYGNVPHGGFWSQVDAFNPWNPIFDQDDYEHRIETEAEMMVSLEAIREGLADLDYEIDHLEDCITENVAGIDHNHYDIHDNSKDIDWNNSEIDKQRY